jgi:hypothetical protein
MAAHLAHSSDMARGLGGLPVLVRSVGREQGFQRDAGVARLHLLVAVGLARGRWYIGRADLEAPATRGSVRVLDAPAHHTRPVRSSVIVHDIYSMHAPARNAGYHRRTPVHELAITPIRRSRPLRATSCPRLLPIKPGTRPHDPRFPLASRRPSCALTRWRARRLRLE